eukprot:1150771-Pelagomonas_calceolata.AAC.4
MLAHQLTLNAQVKLEYDGPDDLAAAQACIKALYLQKLDVDDLHLEPQNAVSILVKAHADKRRTEDKGQSCHLDPHLHLQERNRAGRVASGLGFTGTYCSRQARESSGYYARASGVRDPQGQHNIWSCPESGLRSGFTSRSHQSRCRTARLKASQLEAKQQKWIMPRQNA